MNRTEEENIADKFPYYDLLDQVQDDNTSVEPHYVIDSHSVDKFQLSVLDQIHHTRILVRFKTYQTQTARPKNVIRK